MFEEMKQQIWLQNPYAKVLHVAIASVRHARKCDLQLVAF